MSFSDKRPDPWAAVFAVASLLFPLAAALSMRWTGPWPIIAVLIALLLLRTVLPTRVPVPVEMTLCLLAVAVAELLVALIDAELAARLYPVFMNLTMLLAFGVTLLRPPSMIERFARIAEPDLDAHGVQYTRRVTWVWMGFFVLNGSVALWTALHGSLFLWGLYNGAVSYVFAGMLFAGEYIVRQIVRSRKEVS